MEFLILGPLEVRLDDRVVDLGRQKQRALLLVLLLRANEVVSSDELIEALWDGRPPETAGKALQVHVSQLRKAVGSERVQTRRPGYLLRVEPEEFDLDRCRRLAAEGRPAEALALWRGPPLGEFAYSGFARPEIARLEELRLTLLEERIEQDLAAGRHAELVGELEGGVAEHGTRERLRGQLMLALYRSARQAEALDVFQEGRRSMVDNLGIEPSRQLRDLHHAILNQDPALDFAVPLTSDADSSRGGFFGRDAELEMLNAGLSDAFVGRGRLFLIVGEPGIGKSRLADELVNHARTRGARVLIGRCWEAGGAPAYWPWLQAVRAYSEQADPPTLRGQIGRGAADLAQLVPELREFFPDLTELPPLDPEAARFRLFEAVARFLVSIAEHRPLVLVLDDFHAADEPSLLLLRFLARGLADSRVLVVVAYRDIDPTPSNPLVAAVTELGREPITKTLALSGLAEGDVARFIELVAGEVPAAELVSTIHAEAEGNPLFVGELVRLLVSERMLANDKPRPLVIPKSIRDVITRRLSYLESGCVRILVLASVLGREFDLELLARLAEVPESELLDSLDEAMEARVISDVPDAVGRLRFAHVLIRDALYGGLSTTRRVWLHREVVAILEAGTAADDAELAHHSIAGADFGRALQYARRAADHALELLAYEEAERLDTLALEALDLADPANEQERCELLLALGEAQIRAGNASTAKETFSAAAAIADTNTLPQHLARAALGYGGRVIWDASRQDPKLAPLLEKALVALGDEQSVLRVKVMARLAGGPLRDSAAADSMRGRQMSEEALSMARRIGDPSTLAYGLSAYINCHHSPDFTLRQVDIAKELIQVASDAGDLERAVEGHEDALEAAIELADSSAAHTHLEEMRALADELRQPAQRWVVAVYLSFLALLEGRFDEAEQLIVENRSIGERTHISTSTATYALQLYLLRREQARAREVEELLRSTVLDYPTYPILSCALVHLLTELGKNNEARRELDRLAEDSFRRIPFDEGWSVSLCFLAESAARLGDQLRCATLHDLLLPYADRVSISYTEISLGPVARYLGILAAAAARWETAEQHFTTALEICDRIGARPWHAHTQHEYAQILLARNGREDRQRATNLTTEATSSYRDLGMVEPSILVQRPR